MMQSHKVDHWIFRIRSTEEIWDAMNRKTREKEKISKLIHANF